MKYIIGKHKHVNIYNEYNISLSQFILDVCKQSLKINEKKYIKLCLKGYIFMFLYIYRYINIGKCIEIIKLMHQFV